VKHGKLLDTILVLSLGQKTMHTVFCITCNIQHHASIFVVKKELCMAK